MTLHVGNNQIFDIRIGDEEVDAVYKGADLVWQRYKKIFESSTANTYTLTLQPGSYHIVCIGAGGGGAGNGAKGSSYSAASGSAGAGVDGYFKLEQVKTATIVVGSPGEGRGGGDATVTAGSGTLSSITIDSDLLVSCGGGGGGSVWFRGGSSNGAGGQPTIGSVYDFITVESVSGSAGTHGSASGHFFTCEPPLSNYPQYGFGGRGRGDSSGYYYVADNGAPAYVLIERVSSSSLPEPTPPPEEPLYYCYVLVVADLYCYTKEIITTGGQYTFYHNSTYSKVSSSSELTESFEQSIHIMNGAIVIVGGSGAGYIRDETGDLYL